jgi:hypothetical protein
MRHALGVLGVLAASVLLAVSAAMNYRFGYSLGKTALDGQIYGAASAAADCFKALVPFFFFAALRNRMWSQATAAALVWLVVVGYSLASAFGHAALNRLDTTGQRALEAALYKDLRADAKRTEEQLAWIPKHRPEETLRSEISALQNQRAWSVTRGCTEVTGRSNREFCQQFHKLNAELASAQQAQKLESRLAEIGAKLAKSAGATVMAEADPQASVLSKVTGLDLTTVQAGLTMLVVLLVEIGSGFGMYVAFAHWRLYERPALAAAAPAPEIAVQPSVVLREANGEARVESRRMARLVAPESDVERYYRERVTGAGEGASITATSLYEDYCAWCEERGKEPLALPTFGREFGELGVAKAKIAGRVRYIGIALKSGVDHERDRRLLGHMSRALAS